MTDRKIGNAVNGHKSVLDGTEQLPITGSQWTYTADIKTFVGFPSYSSDSTEYLNGRGEWTTPPGTGGITFSSDSTQYLNGVDEFAAVADAHISFTNVTTNNASSSKHGFLPILPADSTEYLNGQGEWTTPAGGGGGALVQKVGNIVSASSSGSTTIPYDDTKPQNTEGDQYLSQIITPTNSSHILYITVTVFGSVSSNGDYMIVALFQDSTADALAAVAEYIESGTASATLTFTFPMTAGTTSATTFKVRCGGSSGTFQLNGRTSTGRIFGGAAASSITIEEVTP